MEKHPETSFKVMNQDFMKLDRFDGTNYTRWKDKMMFFLTALKIWYVLDPSLPEVPDATPDESVEAKAERVKRQEDELLCRGHILNTLSDRLYDLFTSVQSPREIWKALEFKYNTEKQGADKFIILKFFEFTMFDHISVLDQVHELQILVSKLKDLNVEVSEALQVGAVIAKLPPSWNDYRKKLLHSSENFSLEQIHKHLRIEEETRIRDGKRFGKESDSNLNFIDVNKSNRFGKKRKFMDVNTNSDNSGSKKNKTCFHCKKKGHFKKECRFWKKMKKDHISMITEVNMAAFSNTNGWWYDSGATIHICNDKNLFKDYEIAADGHEVLMGNHNAVKVHGKGTVEIFFTSGKKLTLINVLHVPEVRKNLVSGNLLCKGGFKTVLEANNLILSKNGVFVGKGYTCDGMFKLSVTSNINNTEKVSAYMIDSSISLWHSRLAHVNYKSLKFMAKHGYISYVNSDHDKCEICIQAKMTKLPFPRIERNSELLQIIHSDICELNGHLTRGGN
ncbi:RNA-directed DNA polymerase protein, partial [Dioscorea alata]